MTPGTYLSCEGGGPWNPAPHKAKGCTTVDREEALIGQLACSPGSPAACGTRQRASSAGVCAGVSPRGCPGTAQADSSLQTPPSSRHAPGGSHRVVSCGARPAGGWVQGHQCPGLHPPPSPTSKIGTMPRHPRSHLCTTERTAQGRRERLQLQAQMGHHAHCPLHCCPQPVQPAHGGRHSARHAGRCSPGSAWTGLSPTKGIRRGGQPQSQAAPRAGGAFGQCAVTPICRETAPGTSS